MLFFVFFKIIFEFDIVSNVLPDLEIIILTTFFLLF